MYADLFIVSLMKNIIACPVNELNRSYWNILFTHKRLSQETNQLPIIANTILDSELKLFITLNYVSRFNAELTRNRLIGGDLDIWTLRVNKASGFLNGAERRRNDPADVNQLKAGINSYAYRSACVQRHKSGLKFWFVRSVYSGYFA